MATAITRLITAEMLGVDMFFGMIAAMRVFAVISVIRMETIVHPTLKMFVSVKPRPAADEDAVVKPLGPVVTVRGAVIRRRVVIPVRAFRSRSGVDSNTDLTARARGDRH